MRNILLNLSVIFAISSVVLFATACGIIKGDSKSKLVDDMIKTVNKDYPIDNPVEQKIEQVIEDTTGLEVDFSAGLKEERKEEQSSQTNEEQK